MTQTLIAKHKLYYNIISYGKFTCMVCAHQEVSQRLKHRPYEAQVRENHASASSLSPPTMVQKF